jgi:hypothetical protein
MNVLIFDSSAAIVHIARSVLRGQGHRVAHSTDAADAIRKVATDLIDAVLFGPDGAPRELADFIEREFPRLPLVLAGVPAGTSDSGRLAAVIPAPLASGRLVRAFRRLERARQARIARVPVELAADGVSIACRLAELTPERFVIAGDSDEFRRWFAESPSRVQATLSGRPVAGVVDSAESLPPLVRRVGVKLEGEGGREILAALLKA